MIITEIYNGQGLGNQLACYVTTRVVAADKGFDFGIMNPKKFKCLDFMDLDFGKEVFGGEGPEGGPPIKLPNNIEYYYKERLIFHPNKSDITIDDLNLENVKDNTKLDGYFQSENRIYHRKEEIKNWLKVKKEKDCFDFSSDNICIINFRGGEYKYVPEFFLHPNYWINCIKHMKTINPNFRFIVITDDVSCAKLFFPTFEVFHFDIGTDYSIIKNAKYLILSNSSFPYFATLTSDQNQYILAPKYWGRHNVSDGYWSLGYNIFRNHNYMDREGVIFTYEQCVQEFRSYIEKNSILFRR